MSFMEPEITDRDRHWYIETTSGTWFVPGSVAVVPEWISTDKLITGPWLDAFEVLQDYIEPRWAEVVALKIVVGYCGRMSAPGYLDATEWMFARTKRDIREQLDAIFGD